MRFFWPTKLNPNPGVLTRFGRVLHWIAAVVAAITISICIYTGLQGLSAMLTEAPRQMYPGETYSYLMYPGRDQVFTSLVFSAIATVFYFVGRALRYIFSGE